MAQKLSQLYDVDNRYREAKGVLTTMLVKDFFNNSEQEIKNLQKICRTIKKSDDKFILPAQGGTVSVGALGLGSQLSNTDSRTTFRNAFRASQS